MNRKMNFSFSQWILVIIIITQTACTSSKKENNNYTQGMYGYDRTFLTENNIETIELRDENSGARVLVAPELQGRVMTSTAEGGDGTGFGWINYDLIESGKINQQFNPFGGEERFWLGPEGGPFSTYFNQGDEQVFANWRVPPELDTKPFDLEKRTSNSVSFKKKLILKNASGTVMEAGVNRSVHLMKQAQAEEALGMALDSSLSFVAFETVNTLKNEGNIAWDENNGFLSVWLLCMFNPSEQGVVFIPFKEGDASELGPKVTDDYFGKVPGDRLIVKDRVLFFKTDGKYRSKIGISPLRAEPFCGSYDPGKKVLTLLWYTLPNTPEKYVNSKWGTQDDPLSGDVVNSYNDGSADDGKVMGPFYEIESSSPAALLQPGEDITHIQRIFHISGDEGKLNEITSQLFNLSINEIEHAF